VGVTHNVCANVSANVGGGAVVVVVLNVVHHLLEAPAQVVGAVVVEEVGQHLGKEERGLLVKGVVVR